MAARGPLIVIGRLLPRPAVRGDRSLSPGLGRRCVRFLLSGGLFPEAFRGSSANLSAAGKRGFSGGLAGVGVVGVVSVSRA